jgi:hypothetical protein
MGTMKQPTEEVKVICAWCEKSLGVKEMLINPELGNVPSHGICPECLEDMKKQMGELKNG